MFDHDGVHYPLDLGPDLGINFRRLHLGSRFKLQQLWEMFREVVIQNTRIGIAIGRNHKE